MRRIAQELRRLDEDPIFFFDDATPFTEPLDWGTLIQLLNEDYQMLGTSPSRTDSAAEWLFDRLDRARFAVGATPAIGRLSDETRARLAEAIETEAADVWDGLAAAVSSWTPGDTVVIEFARGGPDGAPMPLAAPYGYAYSLAQLSPEILDRSSILYVWVTPEESRRRNEERALPGRDGDASILHHGVPEAVMLGDYGSDDLPWLIELGGGGTVTVGTGDANRTLPVAVFDNRSDHTSFLREDADLWAPGKVADLHTELTTAFDALE